MKKSKFYEKGKNLLQSVSTKILLLIIILVLPPNLIAVIFTNRAVSALVEQAEFSLQKIADLQMQDLENQMNLGQNYILTFVENDPNAVAMRKSNASDYEFTFAKLKSNVTIRQSLTTHGKGSLRVNGYFCYDRDRKDGVVYVDGDNGTLSRQLRQICQTTENGSRPFGWKLYEWEGKEYLVFMSMERNWRYGALIRGDSFLAATEALIDYPTEEILLSEKDISAVDNKIISVVSTAKKIRMNIRVRKSDVRSSLPYYHHFFTIVSFLYLALIPVLYLVLKRLLIRPLRVVNKAHHQVENGDGDYRIPEISGSIEYEQLFSSFNRMADNLHRLKIERYESEIARQKIELRNLQLQIRPHFLLNTFNIIFSLAQKNETGMIQETVIYLSDYFRYIFRSGKDLELFSKELEMIKGYVRTAAIRYSGRVEATYDIDPELLFVRMPPLLIHNFVENAVKHGIQQEGTLHIYLEGRYDDGWVEFCIQDDGKGMTADVLEKNQAMLSGEYQPEDSYGHLGLYNSLKRLQYFMGEDATISVESEPGYGTSFTIRFSYKLGIENESFDRE